MMNARVFAAKALVRQEKSGYANLVLDHLLAESGLETRDRAFASRIFYGTLERCATLDYILKRFSSRPLEKLDAPVRAVLRSGLYQARYMEVPVSAAINESVNAIRAMGKASAAGTVNAILRRAVLFDLSTAEYSDEIERICVQQSVGRPIVQLMLDAYGAKTEEILIAFFEQRPTAIRVNTCKITPERLQTQLQEEGLSAQPGFVPGALLVQFRGSPAAHPAFRQGMFHVQGQASQFAALCLDARPGQKVLDLCAAPGGKSLTIAQYMNNDGQLICCDAVKSRLPLISQTLKRGGITIGRVEQNDAAIYRERFSGADRILCDVPCSGLGIMGKKPDIRYKSLEDIESLYAIQQNILNTASRYLGASGRLIYSTCTLNPNENERQVEQFLKTHPQFECVLPQLVPEGVTNTGYGLLLLPSCCPTDGFFIATLQKKENNGT